VINTNNFVNWNFKKEAKLLFVVFVEENIHHPNILSYEKSCMVKISFLKRF